MAQRTKVQLATDNASSFPDNTSKAITPAIHRAFNANQIDSFQGQTIDITDAQMGAALAASTIEIGTRYRITNAAQGVIWVWGVDANVISTNAVLEGTQGAGLTIGQWGFYDQDQDFFFQEVGQNYVTVYTVNTGNAANDAITNGQALKDAITYANGLNVGTRSATNRVAVRLMPGTYNANGTGFTMPSFMDLVGQGAAADVILQNTSGNYTIICPANVDAGLYNVDLRPGSLASLYDNGQAGQFYRWDNVLVSGNITPATGPLLGINGRFTNIRGTATAFANVGGDIEGIYEMEVDFGGANNIFAASTNFNAIVKGKFGNFGDSCLRAGTGFFDGSVSGQFGNFGIAAFSSGLDFSAKAEGSFGNFGNNSFNVNNGPFDGKVSGSFGSFGEGCFVAVNQPLAGEISGTYGDFGGGCFVASNTDFESKISGTFGDFGTGCFDITGISPGIVQPEISNANLHYIGGVFRGKMSNTTVRTNAVTVGDNAVIERCKILGNDSTESIIGSTGLAQIIYTASTLPINAGVTGVISNNFDNTALV